MNKPKVSVVIPCHNVQDYIEPCLLSVYKQDYPNLEVIVVDNNSTDKTVEVVKLLKSEKFKDLIILEEERKGANYARNKGLDESSGEFIQFLDADDLIEQTKISHQVALMTDQNADVISSAFIVRGVEERKVLVGSASVLEAIYKQQAGITSSNLFRKEAVDLVRGWSDQMMSSQEFDLMIRLYLNGAKFYFDAESLTVIQERPGRISNSNKGRTWQQHAEIRLFYLEQLKKDYKKMYKDSYTVLLLNILGSLVELSKFDKASYDSIVRKLKIDRGSIKKLDKVSWVTFFSLKLLPVNLILKLLIKRS